MTRGRGDDTMTDISDLFRSPRWEYFRTERALPHGVYRTHADGGVVAVLPLRRLRVGGDWGLNVGALDYLGEGLRDGRLVEGYVALGERRNVLASATVAE